VTVQELAELAARAAINHAEKEVFVLFDNCLWPIERIQIEDDRGVFIRVDYDHPR
jgi:hypothetical protein